jgi:hypothetical protein
MGYRGDAMDVAQLSVTMLVMLQPPADRVVGGGAKVCIEECRNV